MELLRVVESGTQNHLGHPTSSGVSVVIVAYNSAATIGQCLHSVLISIGEDDEVIVVDNASSDGTLAEVQAFLPLSARLRLIANDQNLGFSAGSNVGLRASRGEYLVLLNPDTIVWPRWLEKIRRQFDSDTGAVGPVSDNAGGDQGLVHYLPPGVRLQEIQDTVTEIYAGQHRETKLLFGFCMMLRRDVMDRIGLLDEDLFLGNDDLELSWRLRTHGLKLKVACDVFVHHINHVSFASLEASESHRLIEESSAALNRKLARYYGEVPSNSELWGL